MIVVDSSVVAHNLLIDDDQGDALRNRLRNTELTAPHLLDVEVLSALRRLSAAGLVDGRRADQARLDLVDLSVRRVPHARLVERAWAHRHNLTAYDAMYVALAELLDVPLLTLDARIARAPGLACEVEVLAA